MKKMLFIMNPYAGQRRAAKNLAQILELFNRGGYEVNVYMTAGPGDGIEITRLRAPEVDLVVCCGGDGTFNEAVSGVLQSGADVPMGYIPAGSTNDFATSLGLSLDNLQAARDIVEGQIQRLDVGQFGDRYFSYVASFGAFTRSSYTTPQSMKNALGHAAYVLNGLTELPQLKSEVVRLELPDGRVIEGPFAFGSISNSTSVAGVLTLPSSLVDFSDGKLEIMLAQMPKNLTEWSEVLNAIQKQTYNCSVMTFFSTDSVKIIASDTMPWTLDGERQDGVSEVEIKCVHKAIQFVRPANAK